MTQSSIDSPAISEAEGILKRTAAALSMVKFAHTVFAMPFALVGFAWGMQAAKTPPNWPLTLALVVLAMVGARSFAMAINRIADRKIDAANPRTMRRELPAGVLTLRFAWGFALASLLLFVVACALLNPQAMLLAPLALLVIGGYSLTKRFTALCHLVLGLGLSFAPIGAWIAVTGAEADYDVAETLANAFAQPISLLALGVLLWVAGFDVIYALQDDVFDRAQGLHSIPAQLGRVGALWLSRAMHAGALVAWAMALAWQGSGVLTWVGLGVSGIFLLYEQSLVKAHDLSRVNAAFFTMNGMISVLFAIGVLVDVFVLKG